jgi:hypothetical protein
MNNPIKFSPKGMNSLGHAPGKKVESLPEAVEVAKT